MNKATIMRQLRHKYGITIRELAEAVGLSHQFVSDLELGKYTGRYNYRQSGVPLMQKALESIIGNRAAQAQRLSEDFERNRHRLLDYMEEKDEL